MAKRSSKKTANDIARSHLGAMFRRGASENIPGYIPTGHFDLDFAISYGDLPSSVDLSAIEGYDPAKTLGLPLGKLTELYGEEGAGKSSLAYRVVGYAQKMGYDCAWIDTEHSFSESLATINGVDFEQLIFTDLIDEDNPDKLYCAEHIIDGIVDICKINADLKKGQRPIGVVVLDSVANLVPKSRMEASAEQGQVGDVARLLGSQLGKVANYASKYGVLVILINQLREDITSYGTQHKSPGGRSLRHNTSTRFKLQKRRGKDADIYIEKRGRPELIGRRVLVHFVKNRFAKPLKNEKGSDYVEIPIYYEPYFPNIEEIAFNVGRQVGLIRKYKEEFIWGTGKEAFRGIGKEGFIGKIEIEGLTEDLIFAVAEKAKEEGVLLPPELSLRILEIEKQRKKKPDQKKADQKKADDQDGSKTTKVS